MTAPLVTIICVSYNHERFVGEALESVVHQTYHPIQLIIVDDASTDGSKIVISEFVRSRQGTTFISLDQNKGVCRAFNMGLEQARGEFVIDFAADDILLPDRVEVGVRAFLEVDHHYGVQFGDAEFIDEAGRYLGLHSHQFPHQTVPQGDIYPDLIRRYFVCAPSMMVRKEVFERLHGYDETLAFEDFDFWIRSSREYRYFYLPRLLVKRRLVKGSMSENQFKRGNRQRLSTFQVCEKIMSLNRSRNEQSALGQRMRYEFCQSLKLGDFHLAWKYFLLWMNNRSRVI